MAIGFEENQIVFTGNPVYGVPPDHDIFQYFKSQIDADDYMLYLLYDNYFNSIACLNEMGAAWVSQNDYSLLLSPGFEADDKRIIRKAVNVKKCAIALDNRIDIRKFVEKIAGEFSISIDQDAIQTACNRYFEKLKEIKDDWKIKSCIKLADVERKLIIDPPNPQLLTLKAYYLI